MLRTDFFRLRQKFASLDSGAAFGMEFKAFAVGAMKWICFCAFGAKTGLFVLGK